MRIAIDKNTIDAIKQYKRGEYIYIYDDTEPLDNLLKLGLHCMHKDFATDMDINISRFNLNAFKTANINDKDWYKLAEKKNYKYAIIIPNYNNDHGDYNGKTYLRNSIESVLNQTYKNFELILVDDMSTDTSVETIESYGDARIHLIKNTRKRYNGGSRNVGIEYAKTTDADYICFLDSDDWWKHNEVLEHIDRKLYGHEMMLLGSEMLHKSGVSNQQYNKFDTYEDVYFSINKIWCTAWARVIRIDKIVYFCEDTLMEDRVWSYKQADNCDFERITCLNEIVYCWNRMNTNNSVSIVRNGFWDASAWCHIGHQLQFIENMKHKEFKPILEQRIKSCIAKANTGIYQQF